MAAFLFIYLFLNIICSSLNGPKVSGKRGLIESNVIDASDQSLSKPRSDEDQDRTRRWGKGRRREAGEPAVTAKNRFGNVAAVWFYALIGSFMENKDDVTLWGGHNGAKLLSSMFFTLANVVECTGPNTPGVDVLAKDLFELVWSFRSAELPEVRSSVLYAVRSTLGLLRRDTVLGLLFDGSSESLTRNLQQIAEEDPDSDCRDLARAITQGVASTMQEIDQSPLLM